MRNKLLIKIRNIFLGTLLSTFLLMLLIVATPIFLMPRALLWWLFGEESLGFELKQSYRRFIEEAT